MDNELTDKEIERLDFITDRVGSFINEILPDGKTITVDPDLTDEVITAIWDCLKDRGICTENDFYPFRESVPEGKKFTVAIEVKSLVKREVYADSFEDAYDRASNYGVSKGELLDAEVVEDTVVSAEDENGELMDYANRED